METNKLSRKANEIFKAHHLDAQAKGDDYLGIIRISGSNLIAAECVLLSSGFQTAMIGNRLCAQK